MKLEDIQDLWDKDAVIDRLELGDESLKIPRLHAKYHRIYTSERLALKKYETDFKKLKLEKYEFFTQGPSEGSRAKGWMMPPAGRILKSDVSMYLDADDDIITMTLRIELQQEKCSLLISILKDLSIRNYQIKTALDYLRWMNGSS